MVNWDLAIYGLLVFVYYEVSKIRKDIEEWTKTK